jgi:hypothetical protein
MLVSEKIQPGCALILPKISCQGVVVRSYGSLSKNIFWSHHLQGIEKDMFALMYQSVVIK